MVHMRFLRYAALLLVLGACGTEGEPASETTTTTEETTTTVESTTTTGFSTSVSLPEGFSVSLLDEIVTDAAQRADVAKPDVEVVSVEAMTFNDAALGCPEPGKMSAQVLTPGFVVLIRAADEELDYRVAEGSGEFRLCK